MKRTCIILLVAAASLTGCFEYFNELLTEVDRQWGFHLADTGQSACYDASGNVITCDEGGDYPRQDGLWTDKPTARSFTGPTQHAVYTNDYTTGDNVTGLVWKTCREGYYGSTCGIDDIVVPNTFTWTDAIARCTALNSLNGGAGYAGRTNWRLPTIHELKSIVDYGKSSPVIDTTYFPATPASNCWSSSIDVDDSNYAWLVYFSNGVVISATKATDYVVRCVSD